MSMIDANTLSWVKSEIDETLNQARIALEAYVEDPSDDTQIRFCINYLHQVHGTVQMVELYGAAMAIEEMEKLAVAIHEDTVSNKNDAYETLMRGIIQVPDYLEHLMSGNPDTPVILLPLLNDIRAACGQPLLSEGALFTPDLSVNAPAIEASISIDQGLSNLIKKLRHKYHLGLLAWFKGTNPESGLQQIADVISELTSSAESDEARRVLWIANGLIESLKQGGVETSVATKMLMGQVDRQLKRILDHGELALDEEPPKELEKNLLYYVATSTTTGDLTKEIKEAFNLKEIMPDSSALEQARADLNAPNAALMGTVSSVLLEDISKVKDNLDVFVRADDKDMSLLEGIHSTLTQMSDTLAMLSLGVQRQAVVKQAEILSEIISGSREASDQELMNIAGAMISVENSLSDVSSVKAAGIEVEDGDDALEKLQGAEQQKLMQMVLAEAKVNISSVKDILSEYSRSTDETEQLKPIRGLLEQVAGSLSILSLDKAQHFLQSANAYITNQLVKNKLSPSTDDMNNLADAISSLEYYMESLMGNWGQPEAILNVAEQSLKSLGIDLDAVEEIADEEEAAGSTVEVIETTVETQVEEPAPAANELSLEMEFEESSDVAENELVIEESADDSLELSLDDDSGTEDTGQDVYSLDELSLELGDDTVLSMDDEPVGEISLDDIALDDDSLSLDSIENEGLEFDLGTSAEEVKEHEAIDLAEPEITQTEAIELAEPEVVQTEAEPVTIEETVPVAEPVNEPSLMNDTIDDEIIEIFLEEAEEEHGNITRLLEQWKNNTADEVALKDMRRSFHTLKGSGRLVGALDIGEFAWAYENMLNRLLDGTISASPVLIELLERSKPALEELFELFKTASKPQQSILSLMEYADSLSQGNEVVLETAETVNEEEISTVAEDIDIQEPVAAEQQVIEPEQPAPPVEIDPTLLEIYRKEGQTHTNTIKTYIESWHDGEHTATYPLLRAFHTLTGSSRTAGVQPLSKLCGECEQYVKHLVDTENPVSLDCLNIFSDVVTALEKTLACLDEPGATLPEVDDLIGRIAALDKESGSAPVETVEAHQVVAEPETTPAPEPVAPAIAEVADYDEELLEIFLEEGTEILDECDHTLNEWASNPDDHSVVEALQRQLHTLKGGARMAGITEIGDLGHSIESLLTAVVDGHMKATKPMFELVQRSQDRLVKMLEQVEAHQGLMTGTDLITEVDRMLESRGEDDELLAASTSEPVETIAPQELEAELSAAMEEPAPVSLDNSMIEELQEIELTLDTETEIEDTETISPEITHVVEVNDLPEIEVVDQVELETVAEDTQVTEPQQSEPEVAEIQVTEPETTGNVIPLATEAPAVEADKNDLAPTDDTTQDRRTQRRVQQEQIRVRADLLDNLVNFAGEVSIYRSRLEQQTNNFRYNITEFDETVTRLRDQLRQFEIETEAQIEYRREETLSSAHEDFDPLEMDRFTTMQHLSRAMMESLGDLDSLRGIMNNLTRESETLLLQQSRVNTDLQEGLMRTRMVPFSGQAARLRRIVRQTCGELGKHADLHLHGVEAELDRTVLERVIPPLEHMLRNAVAHGIETPENRKQAGKPESGSIDLSILREGSEIVIKVVDDGGGINLEAIRKKAIERGLIKADANVAKDALLEMIMQSGFSTAETVSQIAGRGVGMDVVNNEIKQLGGIFNIDTDQGKGTSFTIHLPLTLAISRALMVNVGDDTYAIPLLSVEGVERVSTQTIKEITEQEDPAYEWVGEKYQFMHLGSVMGVTKMNFQDEKAKLSLLMVRSGENRAAILVDGLLGSREIVVKPVGPQLSTLRGISGATIMGDGSVVLIIDLGVLIRLAATARDVEGVSAEEAIESISIETHKEAEEEAAPLVMVVDDSITVRKVTTRLLERHEMNVVAAKDGVDALAQLQETIPDVMLLDVEMPRMDGFELATNMRSDERLKNIPIIMITSRTGQKHRDRAASIGVNIYMGKPYTESDLMDNIHLLTGR